MDEEAYRRIYREVNDRQCLFEKAILGMHCSCSRMRKICLAEREAVHCEDEKAHQDCAAWLDVLRHKARFALGTREEGRSLPHARAMRLQVGGLRGLYAALHPGRETPSPIPDVHDLVSGGLQHMSSEETLPFEAVIKEMVRWEGRKPRRRGRNRRS